MATSLPARNAPTVAVIGLGPSGESLSEEAQRLIDEADVLAGGRRQLARFADHPAEQIVLGGDIGQAVDGIRRRLDRRVVVLATGDPLLYGIGATLVRELGPKHVRVLPGISSVQLAFARAGEPWHDAVVLSAHGRPIEDLLPRALAASKMAILTDDRATPAALARALMAAGMEDCRAVVCERLGDSGERVVETHLRELETRTFDSRNVLLVLRDGGGPRLSFGQADSQFESVRGQITKAEVRAVVLAKLRLAPFGVLWDVGAGSGAVAIEAARLMPHGEVYAIERDPDQRACLQRNAARHGAANVRLVAGEAPEALRDLPPAQSVFIGGSGGRLADILAVAPRPLVASLAILEHVSLVLQRFPHASVTQLHVDRSRSMAGGRRLGALNPVYVVEVPA